MRLTRGQRLVLFGPLIFILALGLDGPAVLGFLATFSTYAPGYTAIKIAGFNNYVASLRDREFTTAVRNIVFFTLLAGSGTPDRVTRRT
jgi:hypothetical protein